MICRFKKFKYILITYIILTGLTIYTLFLVHRYNKRSILEHRLIDYDTFEYLLENDLCKDIKEQFLGLLLITSYVGNQKLRLAHRKVMPRERLKEMKFLRVFLLGEIPHNESFFTQQQLIKEQNVFNDLIQGNFIDSFRNLSYKIGMGFKWATTKCAKTKLIIKIDDNVIFDFYSGHKFLSNNYGGEYFIAGNAVEKSIPQRNILKKFYVTSDEYKYEMYADYLQGMFYITNLKTIKRLLVASQVEKYFWIENIFFTGILRKKTNTKLYRINNYFHTNTSNYLYCCLYIMTFGYQCNFIFAAIGQEDIELYERFSDEINKCFVKQCKSIKNYIQICDSKNL